MSNYVTKKELKDATGVETSSLAVKRDFLALKDEADKSCHDLTMLCLNLSDIAIITVKGDDYCCIINDISKSDAEFCP